MNKEKLRSELGCALDEDEDCILHKEGAQEIRIGMEDGRVFPDSDFEVKAEEVEKVKHCKGWSPAAGASGMCKELELEGGGMRELTIEREWSPNGSEGKDELFEGNWELWKKRARGFTNY